MPLLVAGIGVLAAVLLTGSSAPLGPIQIKKNRANVLIDGLSVRDRPEGGQIIDLQVRNSGDRVAYLHTVQFRILAMSEIPFCPHPYAVKSSYTYDLRFPDPANPTSLVVHKRIDQAIPGDDVDRFQFVIGFPDGGLESALYQAKLAIAYNQRESTPYKLAVLKVDGFRKAIAASTIGSDPAYIECLEDTVRNVLQVVGLPGRRSKSVVALRDSTLRLQWELAQG